MCQIFPAPDISPAGEGSAAKKEPRSVKARPYGKNRSEYQIYHKYTGLFITPGGTGPGSDAGVFPDIIKQPVYVAVSQAAAGFFAELPAGKPQRDVSLAGGSHSTDASQHYIKTTEAETMRKNNA